MLALSFNFTSDHYVAGFLVCFALVVLGAAISTVSRYFRYKAKRRAFQDPEPRFLIWDESFAHGYSLKSFRTRHTRVMNCLKLMLTSDTLYVRPAGIFEWWGADCDLVHQIPLASIDRIEIRPALLNPWLRISFSMGDGSCREIDVASKSQRRFETTLRSAVDHAKAHKQGVAPQASPPLLTGGHSRC
jgi:hypothetical protein